MTKDEYGLPVGDIEVSYQIKESMWVCPDIYGDFPTKVDKILVKEKEIVWDTDGNFQSILKLTD